jgi:hypothetical protein
MTIPVEAVYENGQTSDYVLTEYTNYLSAAGAA